MNENVRAVSKSIGKSIIIRHFTVYILPRDDHLFAVSQCHKGLLYIKNDTLSLALVSDASVSENMF